MGSFTALSLAKMGISSIDVFDQDEVQEHNIANQFYDYQSRGRQKVLALWDNLYRMAPDCRVVCWQNFFTDQKLNKIVVVTTDSMHSRRVVWEQYLRQKKCKVLIEARMGAELGQVFTITDKKKDRRFYEQMLYSDDQVEPLPCTGRTIIYNVVSLAGLISRCVKGVIMGERVPRECTLNLTELGDRTWLTRR